MKYSQKEVRQGAIVMTVIVVAALFFIGFTVALAGKFWQKTKAYSTAFQMSAGLKPGDLVRYGGFRVGKITDVRISEDQHGKIEVDLVVDDETPVKTDSIAYINYIGLLGMYYIEISAGTETASLLPPGSVLASRDILQISDMLDRMDSISGIIEHMFAAIDEKVSLILTDATQVLNNVNQLIGNVNQEKVRSILDNVDSIMTTNAETIGGILRNLESMLLQLDALSGSVNSVIVENETEIRATLALMQDFLRSGEATLGDIEEIIGLSKDDIQQVVSNTVTVSQHFAAIAGRLDQNKEHIATMLINLENITTNLKTFSQFADAESGEDLRQLLEHLRRASENAGLILERIQTNNDSVEAILVNLASASQDTAALTAFAKEKRPDLEQTLETFQHTMTHVDQLVSAIDSAQVNAVLESIHSVIRANAGTVTNILTTLEQTVQQVDELSASLNTVVLENDDELQAALKMLRTMLKNGDAAVRQLSTLMTDNQESVQQIVSDTADFSTYLSEVLSEVHQHRTSVSTLLENLETASIQASELLQKANSVETREELTGMLTDAGAAFESLRVFLQMLQDNNARFEEFLVNLTTTSGDASTFMMFLNEQRPDLDLTLQYVQKTAQHLEELSAAVAGKRESLEKTLMNVEAASTNVERITHQIEADWPQVSAILTNVKTLSEHTKNLMEGVNAQYTTVEKMIGDAEVLMHNLRDFSEFANTQRPQFEAMVGNLDESLRNVQAFTTTLQANTPAFEAIVLNLKDTTAEVKTFAEFLQSQTNSVETTLSTIQDVSTDVNALTTVLDEQSDDIRLIIRNLTTTSTNVADFSQFAVTTTTEIDQALSALIAALDDIDAFMGTLTANQPHITSVLTDASEIASNTKQFSRQFVKGEESVEALLTSVQALVDELAVIMAQFKEQGGNIGPTLENIYITAENVKQFSRFVTSLETDLQTSVANLAATLEHLEAVSGVFDQNKRDLGAIVTDTRQTMQNVQGLTGIMNAHAPELETTIANLVEISENVKAFSGLARSYKTKIGKIVDNLWQITQNLDQFSEHIKENPWSITRVVPRQERTFAQ